MVDLAYKLDAVGLWEEHEIEAAARADVYAKGNNALFSAIEPARDRFKGQYLAALESKDVAEKDKLDLFRSDLTAFVNAYDFLSQIVNFEDPHVEMFSIYARGLARLIREENMYQALDLAGVELVGYAIRQQATQPHTLTGEGELGPLTAVGTGAPVDPKMTSLLEAVEQLNSLFDSADFTDADFRGFATHVAGKAIESSELDAQRKANTKQQFLESPDLKKTVISALVAASANSTGMTDELFENDVKLTRFVDIIGKLLYEKGHEAA